MVNRNMYVVGSNPTFSNQGEFIGDPGFSMMTGASLDGFIIQQLFPIGVVPLGAVDYLKAKNSKEINCIRDYVTRSVSSSKENPTQIFQITDAIKRALEEYGIDVNELRSFDREKCYEWITAKNNHELGPFGSIRKK